MFNWLPPAPVAAPRRVSLPAVDSVPGIACRPNVANLINSIATFYKQARDTMDFGINYEDWLKANGGSVMSSATWAKASDSPANPTIAGQTFFPGTESIFLLSGGTVGDVYWMDCTMTVDIVQQNSDQAIPIPSRTIVRRVAVNVIAG